MRARHYESASPFRPELTPRLSVADKIVYLRKPKCSSLLHLSGSRPIDKDGEGTEDAAKGSHICGVRDLLLPNRHVIVIAVGDRRDGWVGLSS
jgi:hypothetical protein